MSSKLSDLLHVHK